MAEEKTGSMLERLREGEKVICYRCGKGYLIPYNTSADKAHYFNCSDPDCNGYIHWDPQIDVE